MFAFLFTSLVSHACPELRGTFDCVTQWGSKISYTYSTETLNGVTFYIRREKWSQGEYNLRFTADGKRRKVSNENDGIEGLMRCEGNKVIEEMYDTRNGSHLYHRETVWVDESGIHFSTEDSFDGGAMKKSTLTCLRRN